MEWEKIFANQIADKGLTSKIFKELIQLDNKKKKQTPNNPIKKIGKGPEQTFFKK